MKIDNSTVDGIINQTVVKLKREKSFKMQFWWLVDQNGALFQNPTTNKVRPVYII